MTSVVETYRWRLSTDKPVGSAAAGVFSEEKWETFGIPPAFSLHHPIKRAQESCGTSHVYRLQNPLHRSKFLFSFLIFIGWRSCQVEYIPFVMMILPKIFERTFSAGREIPKLSACKSGFNSSSSDRAKNAVLPCICSLLVSSLPKNMGVERGR